MEIIYEQLGENTDFVEVFVDIEGRKIKVDQMRCIFIAHQRQALEEKWIRKAKEIYQKDIVYNFWINKYKMAEKLAKILEEKHPKKDIWIGTGKEEVWIYHKNGNVMKIVNVEEYFNEKRRNKCQN